MIGLLLNHLWQSTLCMGLAGVLTLGLRQNSASVRFWVWFAASVKFLVPFIALTALSASLFSPVISPVVAPEIRFVQPFAAPSVEPSTASRTFHVSNQPRSPARPVTPSLSPIRASSVGAAEMGMALLAIWAAGCMLLVVRRTSQWL